MQIWCLAVSMLWCFLFFADLMMGMEELELHYRCRGRSNFRKIRLATMSVRMVEAALVWCESFHAELLVQSTPL